MFIIFFISARITSFLLDVFEIRGSMVLSALKGDKLDSEITFWSEKKNIFYTNRTRRAQEKFLYSISISGIGI